ncbi:MAG TPA: hypothetical protein VLB86_13465 [Gaiellaceae bacterium]|nr:hypothetical protein [Gaiellaceae bacterium]
MRLTVNDSAAIPALLAALRDAGCAADHAGPNSVEVLCAPLPTSTDVRVAVVELTFFARVWEAANPGLRISLAPA